MPSTRRLHAVHQTVALEKSYAQSGVPPSTPVDLLDKATSRRKTSMQSLRLGQWDSEAGFFMKYGFHRMSSPVAPMQLSPQEGRPLARSHRPLGFFDAPE